LSFHIHLIVTTETQENSTIIKTYPTTIKPGNQETKGDVHGFSRENHVYMPLAKGKHAYVCDCQEKTHVYVSKYIHAKEKDKKLRIRVNRGCQAIIRQETQYKQEKSKEKRTPNPEKEDYIPNMVVNSLMRRISLWLVVKHNRRE
jgi:hypothetical protein